MTHCKNFCGIDLGGTKIELVVLSANGRELLRERKPTPQGDYGATLATIAALVDEAEAVLGTFDAVGIGTPGAISKATGLMKNCNSTCLNGQPLLEDLEKMLSRPVRIANDADCFALSEATDGAAAGADTVFGVILGTGVGAGVVVRGQLLSGPNSIAGEWGHNPLPWPRDEERPGPACYCGRSGCIETFLSGPGLALSYQSRVGWAGVSSPTQHLTAHSLGCDGAAAQPTVGIETVLSGPGRQLSAAEIASLAEQGDPGCEAVMQVYEERLARALAHVINILDPHVIVLGGGLSNCERLYENVPQLWGRHVFSDRVDTRLVPPRFGDSSGVRGAAWLWA